MRITRITLILLLATVLYAKDKKLKAVPVTPPSTTQAVTLADLQGDIDHLKAQLGWCQQEMQIWQSVQVMQTRLTLAIENAKAQERAKAKATKAK